MRPVTLLLLSGAAYVFAQAALPYSASHRLGEGCQWLPRYSLGRLKLETGKPTMADKDRQRACFVGRGLKDVNGFLWDIRDHWPSKRELRKLEAKNARRYSLPAEGSKTRGIQEDLGR